MASFDRGALCGSLFRLTATMPILCGALFLQVHATAWPTPWTTHASVTVQLSGEPKSGTTWMGVVVGEVLAQWCGATKGCQLLRPNLAMDVSAVTGTQRLACRVATYKHLIPHIGHADCIDGEAPPKISNEKMEAAANKLVKEMRKSKRYIVIFRDPRDVAVSACHHRPSQTCKDRNVEKYTERIIGRVAGWVNLRYRLFRAVQARKPTSVRIYFYEELKQDPMSAVVGLAELFGIQLSQEQMALVVQRSSFSAMKNISGLPGGAKKMRKGHTCGFKKELSREVAERVTLKMQQVLLKELEEKWMC